MNESQAQTKNIQWSVVSETNLDGSVNAINRKKKEKMTQRFIAGRPIFTEILHNNRIQDVPDLVDVIRREYPNVNMSNNFVGDNNSFYKVTAQHLFLTSDRKQKANIQPIKHDEATRCVRNTKAYYYTIGERQAAGLMADEVPTEYTQNGGTAVDYMSMLALLWTAVQDLDARLEENKRRRHAHRRRSSVRVVHRVRGRGARPSDLRNENARDPADL